MALLTPGHLAKFPFSLCVPQSLLCGPTLDVSSILPLLEQLPDSDNAGLSVHVLVATRLGQTDSSIERLLDRCPQAIISFAHDELKNDKMVADSYFPKPLSSPKPSLMPSLMHLVSNC